MSRPHTFDEARCGWKRFGSLIYPTLLPVQLARLTGATLAGVQLELKRLSQVRDERPGAVAARRKSLRFCMGAAAGCRVVAIPGHNRRPVLMSRSRTGTISSRLTLVSPVFRKGCILRYRGVFQRCTFVTKLLCNGGNWSLSLALWISASAGSQSLQIGRREQAAYRPKAPRAINAHFCPNLATERYY